MNQGIPETPEPRKVATVPIRMSALRLNGWATPDSPVVQRRFRARAGQPRAGETAAGKP